MNTLMCPKVGYEIFISCSLIANNHISSQKYYQTIRNEYKNGK